MGYADGRYQARHNMNMVGLASVTMAAATFSASGATGTYANYLQKEVAHNARIEGGKAYIAVAPTGNSSGTVLALMDGTTTVGTAAIGTNTAGVTIDFSITAANALLTAGDQLDIDLIGTATSSATAGMGNYAIDIDYTEILNP